MDRKRELRKDEIVMGAIKWLKTKWSVEDIQKWNSIRKVLYVLLVLLIYSLLQDIIELLVWYFTDLAAGALGDDVIAFLGVHSETVTGIVYGIASILALLPFKGLIQDEITSVIKRQNEEKSSLFQKAERYVWLAFLALGASFCLNFLMSFLKVTENSQSYQSVANAQYGVTFWVGLFLYGVVSPITEEIIYRGVTYNRLKRTFGRIPGILISAVLFGCFHGNMVQAVYGTLMGILLAWCYEKYEGFLAPVLVHVVANLGIYTVTYGNRLTGISYKMRLLGACISGCITLVCFLYIQKKILKEKCRKQVL